MKKFFMIALSFTLLVALALTGCDCSCSSTPNLSFNSNFYGGQPAEETYVETLTYNVSYNADGFTNLAKSTATDAFIAKDGIDYTGSELVTTLRIGGVYDAKDIPSEIVSEENRTKEKIEKIYVYTTKLTLTATYNFIGQDQPTVIEDFIETEVYFLPETLSFAPIYSTYKADMHVFSSSNQSRLARIGYDYKTVYNLEEFTMTNTTIEYLNDGSEQLETKEFTEEYDYKKAIDNNQLLFAIRNFTTDAEQTTSLPVVNSIYNDTVTCLLSAHANQNYKLGEETVATRSFSINLNNQRASGLSHYFTVQTGASSSGKNNALLVNFAQPLYDYGTMSCVGALEFTLNSIS